MSITKTKPARAAVAVTASDATVYNPPLRSIWVGGAGDIALILADDSLAVTFPGVTAGTLLPFEVSQVMSTNTTATDIVGVR